MNASKTEAIFETPRLLSGHSDICHVIYSTCVRYRSFFEGGLIFWCGAFRSRVSFVFGILWELQIGLLRPNWRMNEIEARKSAQMKATMKKRN